MMNKGGATVGIQKGTWKTKGKDRVVSFSSGIALAAGELHQRYKNILEPLSLISPPVKEIEGFAAPPTAGVDDEGALPPTIERIRKLPASLEALCDLVQKKICVRSEVTTVSKEDQEVLGGVILSEVKLLWEDIKNLLPDPTLSCVENKEISSQMFTYFISVCEQLFLHYLYMVDLLRQREVFTDQANLSRLGAQLSIDCSKFLNVRAIRHHAIAGVKARRKRTSSDSDLVYRSYELSNLVPAQTPHHLYNQYIPGKGDQYAAASSRLSAANVERPLTLKRLLNRSTAKRLKPQQQSRESVLREIDEKIPYLDLTKVPDLPPCQKEAIRAIERMPLIAPVSSTPEQQSEEEVSPEHQTSTCRIDFQRCPSLPNLRDGERLSDELQINLEIKRPQTPLVLLRTGNLATDKYGQQIAVAKDLKRLLYTSVQEDLLNKKDIKCCDTNLPPVIGAITRTTVDNVRHQKLKETLKKLEEEEMKSHFHHASKASVHPQASATNVRLSQNMVARAADVRVTDRALVDHPDILIYPPVYSEALGEIEPSTVKWLDRNLYIGDEIKEVYDELSKSVQNDYLMFGYDADLEPAAVSVDLSTCWASSTLRKRKEEQIINAELDRASEEQISKSHEVMQDAVYSGYFQPDAKSSKHFASWLILWKTIIDPDDYLKYICTKETDFLKVIFHLYETSCDEEETKKRQIRELQEKLKRERELKIAELMSKKEDYVPGMWNINSVMLGGLGKDPAFEGMEVLQERLEKIWASLHVPESERLDMAIKYSSRQHMLNLPEVTFILEKAVELITERESILAKLELFEQTASDPNRFFEKGFHGSSEARLHESKKRKKLHSELSVIEMKISEILHQIKKKFDDIVSYKGRPYLDKMQRDKIEMLYWLQQERRKLALKSVSFRLESPRMKLPPIELCARSTPVLK
ncbi:coiled-coil domain-containing protein 87 isoform X2 [Latimeria chalumnae]|uniref:coiled-coil domain-containing protein 87 isoform X2 n=1 Tax=Latimeria chalumnae TaxID=7897 RepID=UPI00313DB99A